MIGHGLKQNNSPHLNWYTFILELLFTFLLCAPKIPFLSGLIFFKPTHKRWPLIRTIFLDLRRLLSPLSSRFFTTSLTHFCHLQSCDHLCLFSNPLILVFFRVQSSLKTHLRRTVVELWLVRLLGQCLIHCATEQAQGIKIGLCRFTSGPSKRFTYVAW